MIEVDYPPWEVKVGISSSVFIHEPGVGARQEMADSLYTWDFYKDQGSILSKDSTDMSFEGNMRLCTFVFLYVFLLLCDFSAFKVSGVNVRWQRAEVLLYLMLVYHDHCFNQSHPTYLSLHLLKQFDSINLQIQTSVSSLLVVLPHRLLLLNNHGTYVWPPVSDRKSVV